MEFQFLFSSRSKLLYSWRANRKYKMKDTFSGWPEDQKRINVSIEWIFDATKSRSISVRHRVKDPIQIISDSGVDSRDARGTARLHPVTDHTMLDETYHAAIVLTVGLQRPTAITEAGIHVAQTTGAHLLVPDLRRSLIHLFALIVGHQRQPRLEKIHTARARFRRAPTGHYRLPIRNEKIRYEIGRKKRIASKSLENVER